LKTLVGNEVRDQLINSATTAQAKSAIFPPVKTLPEFLRLRILVTGGSGFVGSHLVDRLMMVRVGE
jgi:FlaA1/EpsC-like NDP-sugar epimerase